MIASGPKTKRSPLKKAAFAAVAVILALVALELVLGLSGLVEVFRPFELRIEAAKSHYVYQFNSRTPPIETPKRKGVYRVLVLGASSTNGYPFEGVGWPEQMDAMLSGPEAGATDYEIVNLATNGVTTSFLLEVLRDALPRLEPDLVIVCSGDNEILGRSPIDDLRRPILKALSWRLRRTSHLYNLPARVMGFFLARGAAVGMMLEIARMEDGRGKWLNPPEVRAAARDNYLYLLRRMVELGQTHGVKVALCAPGSNLADWVPMKSTHGAGLSDQDIAAIDQLLDSLDLHRPAPVRVFSAFEPKFPELSALTTRDPDFAKGWFYLGQAELASGLACPALTHLETAVERADFFQQTPSSWSQAVRDLAAQLGAPLIDQDRMLRAAAPQGAPGFDLFVDGCHPTPEGHRLIAVGAIIDLAQARILPSIFTAFKTPPETEIMRHLGSPEKLLALAYFNQAMVLAFLHRPDEYKYTAIAYLDRAIELGMTPALAATYKGYLEYLLNDPNAARDLTLARLANEAIFKQTLSQKLCRVAKLTDPGLELSRLPPDRYPELYPSSDAVPAGCAQEKDLELGSARFYWDGQNYQAPKGEGEFNLH